MVLAPTAQIRPAAETMRSAAAVARRYARRAARAELEAAKAAAAVTELRRDLAEALAREATLRAAHAGAS